MTWGDSVQDSGVALDRELTLFEYDTCLDPVQAAALYDRRQCLQPYLKHRWLTRAFENDKPCIRGANYVGVLPFSVEGKSHLLLIAPKGCQQDPDLGLLRFLELLAFDEGGTPPEEIFGWEGKLGPHRFLLFLARHYAALLNELCGRDFRLRIIGPRRTSLRSRLYPRSAPPCRATTRAGQYQESRTSCRAVGTSLRWTTGIIASSGPRLDV